MLTRADILHQLTTGDIQATYQDQVVTITGIAGDDILVHHPNGSVDTVTPQELGDTHAQTH